MDDVDNGDETALSAKRWVYASFFNRLKRQVAQNWDPASVWRRGDPTGQVYGFKTRVTEVRVSLSADRRALAKIVVTAPCGVSELDDEAVRAFKSAAPFPNPPKELSGQRRHDHVRFLVLLRDRSVAHVVALARILISIALVGAVLCALLRDPARRRLSALDVSDVCAVAERFTTRRTYAARRRSRRKRHGRLPAETSGSSEVLQAAALYEDAVISGGGGSSRRCATRSRAASPRIWRSPTSSRCGSSRARTTCSHCSITARRGVEHVRVGPAR